MNEELYHHGIKGMKWGVRRTPEQLGHTVSNKSASSFVKKPVKVQERRSLDKAHHKSTYISDDELRRRIERLNLEERYEELVSRQRARENTGFKATLKELAAKNLKSGGDQLLGWAVSKAVDRITGRNKSFNIDEFKNMDVNNMDADTVAKVAKYYGDVIKIKTSREVLNPSKSSEPSKDSKSSKSSESSKDTKSSTSAKGNPSTTSSSSGKDYTKRPEWGDHRLHKPSRKQLNEWISERNRAIFDLSR